MIKNIVILGLLIIIVLISGCVEKVDSHENVIVATADNIIAYMNEDTGKIGLGEVKGYASAYSQARASLILFDVFDLTKNTKYKDAGLKVLGFIIKNLYDENSNTLYYSEYVREERMDSTTLLSFLRAYQITQDQHYKKITVDLLNKWLQQGFIEKETSEKVIKVLSLLKISVAKQNTTYREMALSVIDKQINQTETFLDEELMENKPPTPIIEGGILAFVGYEITGNLSYKNLGINLTEKLLELNYNPNTGFIEYYGFEVGVLRPRNLQQETCLLLYYSFLNTNHDKYKELCLHFADMQKEIVNLVKKTGTLDIEYERILCLQYAQSLNDIILTNVTTIQNYILDENHITTETDVLKGTWTNKTCPDGSKAELISLIEETPNCSDCSWRKAVYCRNMNKFWIADSLSLAGVTLYGPFDGYPSG